MGVATLISQSSGQLSDFWSLKYVAIFFLISSTIYLISHVIYNLYFHPLSKFPGPKFAAISNIWFARAFVSGQSTQIWRAIHDEYGEIVRTAPDELSFSSSAAWKDIYGQRKSGECLLKDHKYYITDDRMKSAHLVNVIDPSIHAQSKKIWSPAFSTKYLLEREDIFLKYADMLMVAMTEESLKGPMNLNDCYNWVTFDVLGEFAFGESFGSLAARKTDDWISTILTMVKFIAYDCAIYRLSPTLEKLSLYLIPPRFSKGMLNHVNHSKAKILARMNRGEHKRKDFCSYIFQMKEEMNLSEWDMAAYSNSMIIAGSETSSTVLSALTHWLGKTPDAYSKLKDEVRSRFNSSSEITSQSATFPYLTAVIHEALRMFPPVPFGPPRIIPKGGEMLGGVFVPGGTTVGVHMFATTRNPKNFKDPDTFRPERWIDPNCTDDLSASQPFLLGPRACIGQNMAWMELRILIAKLVFLFDFELVDKEVDWGREVNSLVLWERPDLMTKVTRRNVS